jgi:hypothetical protein
MSPDLDSAAVQRALRSELEGRGYTVAGDTVGLRGELYIRGDGDRAAALFEFKSTVEEAFSTMYQGSWLADMPPRFAVLPASEKDDPAVDILRQAGLKTLFYDLGDGGIVFEDIEEALATTNACEARERSG